MSNFVTNYHCQRSIVKVPKGKFKTVTFFKWVGNKSPSIRLNQGLAIQGSGQNSKDPGLRIARLRKFLLTSDKRIKTKSTKEWTKTDGRTAKPDTIQYNTIFFI